LNGSWANFPVDLVAATFAAAIAFTAGLVYPAIPRSRQELHVRHFWGKGALAQDFMISYGAFLDSRLLEPLPPKLRYVKNYHDGRRVQFVGPLELVAALAELRSASYILNALSKHIKGPISVVVDEDAFKSMNRTVISVGSSLSNEITDLIMREPNNAFFEFVHNAETTHIKDKRTGRTFTGFEEPVRKDLGIVLKIENLRFPGHFFFVCAGLGEWGTSGTSWYLANKWRDLDREFKGSFGLVIEVAWGCDQSAQRIFPLPLEKGTIFKRCCARLRNLSPIFSKGNLSTGPD
jgi:hypothetical protein